MALLGCLSLVQIVFLPGWLALRVLRVPASLLRTVVLSFGLSLVINHFLVVGLVALHWYRPASLIFVLAIEIGTALALNFDSLALPLSTVLLALNDERRTIVWRLGLDSSEPGRSLRRLSVLAAAGVMIVYAISSIGQFGDVFRQWDAVVSWNRWAIEWANNGWPQSTSLYPQLLPTNVSMTYVFMQTSDIWCFGKGFQFLFCLMTLMGIFDLAVVRRSPGIIIAVPIAYCLFVALLRYRMLASGYADVPVAFFTFTSVAMLWIAADCDNASVRGKYLLVGSLLAVGAALTKQVGLYVAAVYPLLAWQLVYARRIDWRAAWAQLLRIVIGIGLLAAPWYCLKKIEVGRGLDHDNTLALVQGYQQGRTIPQRFVHAVGSVSDAISSAGLVCVAVLLMFAFVDRKMRWTILGLVLPWALIWSIGFSYDLRNLAVVLPWTGVACGVALERLGHLVGRSTDSNNPRPKLRGVMIGRVTGRLRIAHAIAAATLASAVVCYRIDEGALISAQLRRQREVGIPDVNALLYDYDRTIGIRGLVATDYLAMPWLPGLASHRLVCSPQNLKQLRCNYERSDVRYALFCREGTPREVWDYLQQSFSAGSSRLVFETKLYRFFVKIGVSAPAAATIVRTDEENLARGNLTK